MSDADPREAIVQRGVESLYEDERLRSALPDAAATPALEWASQQLRAAVERAAPGASEAALQARADDALKSLRTTLRALNDLTATRKTLSAAQLGERLMALLAMEDRSPSVVIRVDDLVGEQGTLDDAAWVTRVLALLDEARTRRRANRTPPPAAPSSAQKSASQAAPPPDAPRGNGFAAFAQNTRRLTCGALLLTLLVCGCALVAGYFLLSGGDEQSAAPPAATRPPVAATTEAPPAAWYQLFFTEPVYPDDPALHTGTPLGQTLTDVINSATRSVEMAIYQLDLPDVTQALLDAEARGVTVRVVTDIDSLEDPAENEAFLQLEAAGINVVGGNRGAIMHNKFVVVDGRWVWTGSWNFTENDSYRYNNHAILIDSPELAQNYSATFRKMWLDQEFAGQREAGGTRNPLTIQGVTVETYFSPEDNVAGQIVRRIQAAQTSIDFLAFSFTDDNIGAAVLARAAAGVQVRGVFENTGSNTPYSEFGPMREAGLAVFQDGNPYLMHHKAFIIDGKTVILGSFNFSQSAQESNDENILIIDDAEIAAQFTQEFERVLFQARNPPN